MVALLVMGAAGLAIWLQLTYDPDDSRAAGADAAIVAVALPRPGPADDASAPIARPGDGAAPPPAASTAAARIAVATVPAPESEPPPVGGHLNISAWAGTRSPATAPPPFPGSEAQTAEPDSPSAEPTAAEQASPPAPASEADADQTAGRSKPQAVAALPGQATASTAPPASATKQRADAPPAPDRLTQALRPGPNPAQQGTDRPRIAIVLSGLGRNKLQTEAVIGRLPPEITLAFNPEGRELQTWVDRARARGHEVILELPMEPVSFPENDPGPHTLLTSLSNDENLKRLGWILDRFDGYIGVTNYMGSRFTTSRSHLTPVMAALKDRDLAFLDGRASADSIAAKVASEAGLAVASNDRYLDAEASRAAIGARLAELEEIARSEGEAIGISLSYPVTIDMLAQWAPTLASKGLRLAPLSAVVDGGRKAP